MAAISNLLDRLPELHARLLAADFVPDASRWLAVNDLLLRLYEQDRLPEDAAALRRLLAPLFCSNRTQQQDFQRIFSLWAESDQEQIKSAEPLPVHTAPAAEQGYRTYIEATRRWPLWLAGLVVGVAIAFGAYRYYQDLHSATESGDKQSSRQESQAAPQPTGPDEPLKDTRLTPQPIPPRSPPEAFHHSDEDAAWLYAIRSALVTLPGIVAFGIWLDRRRRRRAVLKQSAGDQDDPFLHLPLARSGLRPYWGGHIPRVLHRLRRGAPMATRQLDLDRTVDATVRDGGIFRPVRLTRRWRPEYVLLIERRHGWDHIAGLGHALVERLKKDGLAVYPYEFRGSPEYCFEDTPGGRRLRRLQALQARHPYARVIALGESDGLFDPLTGAPLASVFKPLRFWPGRAWLTTRPQPWAYREAELAKEGFAVAPLLGAGVEAIANWLEAPASKGIAPWYEPAGTEHYPPMLQHDAKGWLQDEPPLEHDLDDTLRALRAYLGYYGMELLTAMAAYPGIHVGLTIVLDQKLFPGQSAAQREQRLLRLGRLPWCRYGRMPDYFRARLLHAQRDAQRANTRAAYLTILQERAGITTRDEYWALPFRVPRRRRFLDQLRDRFRYARPDSPLDDRIFARLMLGGKPGPLNFELPKRIAESLLLPRAGWTTAMLALLAALSGAWLINKAWEYTVEPWTEAWVKQEDAQYHVGIARLEAADQKLDDALRTALVNWGFVYGSVPNSEWSAREIATSPSRDKAQPQTDTSMKPFINAEFERELISWKKFKVRAKVVYPLPSARKAAERIAARLSYLIYASAEIPVVESESLATIDRQSIFVFLFDTDINAGGVFRDPLTGTYTPRAAGSIGAAVGEAMSGTALTVPIEPDMVDIPAGTFLMGSPESEDGRQDYEGPQHKVGIAAFKLGKYEVTFAEYERHVKDRRLETLGDEGWGRGRRPVIHVSWEDARAYAQWLSDKTGKRYRLPTEAEWEYAARAGSTTPFATGDCLSGKQANIDNRKYAHAKCPTDEQYIGKTAEAGLYPPNGYGLHDMHGNVWEWTQDCWHDNYNAAPENGRAWEENSQGGDCELRVYRGGSWSFGPRWVRSAGRGRLTPGARYNAIGFRLAQDN